jgi:hypothetical protein
MTEYKSKFDFEIGYLIKSPCKGCLNQDDLPACAENCPVLDKIHGVLCGVISSARSQSSIDSCTISVEDWPKK